MGGEGRGGNGPGMRLRKPSGVNDYSEWSSPVAFSAKNIYTIAVENFTTESGLCVRAGHITCTYIRTDYRHIKHEMLVKVLCQSTFRKKPSHHDLQVRARGNRQGVRL